MHCWILLGGNGADDHPASTQRGRSRAILKWRLLVADVHRPGSTASPAPRTQAPPDYRPGLLRNCVSPLPEQLQARIDYDWIICSTAPTFDLGQHLVDS